MANGESLYVVEKRGERFVASWNYPLGTVLKITNLRNGKSTVVTVKDRGPAKRLGRSFDLSKSAFSDIEDPKKGLVTVRAEVIQ